ncbi:hypothetical protein AAVH_24812 [Aphelenchoides avenae]|nr:hypothetical protein AAVH_24812 [Aphelenchus avenae]
MKWYDGTVASDIRWVSGCPVGGPNTLVQMSGAFELVDTAPPITKLLCKKTATNIAYDACAKFKACT